MTKFEELDLSKELLNAINYLGFKEPTEIQAKSIPYIMEGKDVIGESKTGSGKTLAFGCGVIDQVVPKKGLQALILTPTRELAEQVKDSIVQFSLKKQLKIITVYGGVSINNQIDDLKVADVVIATPGRFLDHMNRRTVNTTKVKLLILDEADRMLDMGFIDDVEKIIRVCPKTRQTLFFSATISKRIIELTQRYMNNPVKIQAEKQVDPSKLNQFYYDVKTNQKLSLLVSIIRKDSTGLGIIFCNTRNNTDFVEQTLKTNKIDVIAIHGGMTQSKRIKSIEMFNKGKAQVLACTDVASRGIHIDNVSHIYNYDIPKDPKDYVHRIGRTARAGEEGKVINLLSPHDHDNYGRIRQEYRFKIDRLEKPEMERIVIRTRPNSSRNFKGKGNFGKRGPKFRR